MDLYSISSTYKINAKRFENILLQVKEAALWCVKLDIAMRTTRDEFIYRITNYLYWNLTIECHAFVMNNN